MKRTVSLTILVSLALLSAFLVQWISNIKEEPPVFQEQTASFSSLLAEEFEAPRGVSAESAAPFAQNFPGAISPVPPPPVPTQPLETNASPAYIYFFTGIPVRPAPTTVFMYTTTPAPAVQSYAVPVFVPQVVPSRVGAPKLVYSNGVVIKPKVYFPNQPARNVIRGVTP